MIKIKTNGIYFHGKNKEFMKFIKENLWANITIKQYIRYKLRHRAL